MAQELAEKLMANLSVKAEEGEDEVKTRLQLRLSYHRLLLCRRRRRRRRISWTPPP